ncbi:RNA polymerase sigma factor, sigma-70 family [Burkholderiales bacterium JOSHI_001]|nr:RNA polymerase sigma factor, sigma-70 family [Burkholderiales bacterium JOSHI_001]
MDAIDTSPVPASSCAADPDEDAAGWADDAPGEPAAQDLDDADLAINSDPDTAGTRKAAMVTGADDAQLAQWMQRIVQRDEQALAALYDATLSRTYGLVLRIVKRAALAEEVVEDAYFQVWRQAPRFDPARGKAITWLLAMARSRAIDALRREARFQADSLDDEAAAEHADDQAPADELLDTARRHADLHQALQALNPQPRQLLALAFFRGLSHEEIASQTALPLGTVKSQIRRALIALSERLGEPGLGALTPG